MTLYNGKGPDKIYDPPTFKNHTHKKKPIAYTNGSAMIVDYGANTAEILKNLRIKIYACKKCKNRIEKNILIKMKKELMFTLLYFQCDCCGYQGGISMTISGAAEKWNDECREYDFEEYSKEIERSEELLDILS